MGLGSRCGGDVVVDDGAAADDGGGGVDCGNGGKSFSSVSCSICLETVTDNGDRSWAKLQCGHQFHLDCIGSAFNIKGAMQCPNCRKIEKGQWLYANGGRSYPEFNVDDLRHDEDLYDLSYSEMSFGVHWCPFGSLAQLPSFEVGEFSSPSYHELLEQQAMFAEHSASAAHPCPYVAYIGPTIHPSSSNSSGSVSDSSSFNGIWNGSSVPSEMPTSYALPAMDLRYHSWEHHSPLFSTSSSRIGSSDHLQIRPSAKGPLGAALTCQDQDLLCIHLLLATVLVQEQGVRLLPRCSLLTLVAMLGPMIESKLSRHTINNTLALHQAYEHPLFLAPEDQAVIEVMFKLGQQPHHPTRWVGSISFRPAHPAVTFRRQKILSQVGSTHGKEILFLHFH